MARWQLIKDARLHVLDEGEGGRIATRLQEVWAEQFPKGINGRRCIFKWDNGKFYYADIPMRQATEVKRIDLN